MFSIRYFLFALNFTTKRKFLWILLLYKLYVNSVHLCLQANSSSLMRRNAERKESDEDDKRQTKRSKSATIFKSTRHECKINFSNVFISRRVSVLNMQNFDFSDTNFSEFARNPSQRSVCYCFQFIFILLYFK